MVPTHHLPDPPPRLKLLSLQEPIRETLVELHVKGVDPVLCRLKFEEEFD